MEVNEEFLREVGLAAMPESERRAFLEYVQEEIEVRIGEKISAKISEDDMQEFDAMDDERASAWLEEKCPSYKMVVRAVIDEMKAEIGRNRDKILA